MELINVNTSEKELWHAIKMGDQLAFKIVFKRYFPTLLATAKHYLNDESSCENVVQEIFLTIWLKKEHLEINDFKTYLKAATRYQVYKVMRDAKAASHIIFTADELGDGSIHLVNQGEEWFHASALKAQIKAYLLLLPKRCREIYMMSREEELSNREIAEKLQISKRTVENQLTTALHHLRTNIKNYLFLTLMTTILLKTIEELTS
jgi:RNA polymerase sigma-70 factor (family 1)